jgi:hypothetical protein
MSFSLIGRLGLDTSGIATGLAKAQNLFAAGTSRIRANVKGQIAAAFGTAAIMAATRSTIQYADEIHNLSKRLAVSTDLLQEWRYAATQSGSSAEAVGSFWERLIASRAQALAGNQTAIESFERFGITLDELRNIPIEQIGTKIAEAFRKGNPQQFIDALRQIGGRSATDLVSAFASGMTELAAQARATGQVIEKELIEKIAGIREKIDELAGRLRGPLAHAVSFTLQGLNAFADAFMKSWRLIGGFVGHIGTTGWGQGKFDFFSWIKSREARDIIAEYEAEYAKPKVKPGVVPTFDAEAILTPPAKNASREHPQAFESFDALAKIGGFAQSGADYALVSALERIARATEETAANTDSWRQS